MSLNKDQFTLAKDNTGVIALNIDNLKFVEIEKYQDVYINLNFIFNIII